MWVLENQDKIYSGLDILSDRVLFCRYIIQDKKQPFSIHHGFMCNKRKKDLPFLSFNLDGKWIFPSTALSIYRKPFKSAQCVPAQIQSPAPAWTLTASGLLMPTSSLMSLLLDTPPLHSSFVFLLSSLKGCIHLACLYCVINLTLHLGFIFWKFWMVSWKCCWTIGALWT